MTNAERLHAAASAWQQGARTEALASLMALWREWKSIGLGDRITRLTEVAATGRAPIRPASSKSAAQLWREVAAENDPLDLPRLLEPIPTAITSLQRERAEVLAAMPAHPLLTRAVLEWWKKPERRVEAMTPWLIELARAAADPVMAEPLQALMPAHLAATRRVGRANAKAAIQLALEARAWTAPVEDEGEVAALAALDALVGRQKAASAGSDLPALFAKVYAAPKDDALRALLADELVAQGDARGEFVSLQLMRGDAKPSAAEKKLLSQWRDTWLGRLGPCFRKGVEFKRGFPVHGAYEKGGDPSWPEWSTFESFDFTPALLGGADLLESPHLTSLESVVGLGGSMLQARERFEGVFGLEATTWHTLGFLAEERLVPAMGALLTARRFPNVRTLVLSPPVWGSVSDGVLLAAMRSAWFSRVKHLDVAVQGAQGVVAAASQPFESLVLRGAHGAGRAELRDGVLSLDLEAISSRAPEVLLLALEHLPATSYGRVTLSLPRGTRAGTVLSSSTWRKVDLGPLLERLKRLSVPVESPWS